MDTSMVKSLCIVPMLIALVTCDDNITIQTKLGKITGISSSVSINDSLYGYTVYKNIPYAKPPIGNLRFREPVAFGAWKGTLDATKFGPSCIQIQLPSDQFLPNFNQSEDCLSLNIYIPTSTSSSTDQKSVMIWIHGGGYSRGQAMFYDASYLATFGDVIVVTVNYRLEAFGFFSTTDSVAPGNYGLWDQKLAIQWAYDNIDSFGGDTKSVTIFGESAGGFSVALQAINPTNKGLFQRVIAQSGVSNSLLATSPVARLAATELVQLLNCSIKLTADTMDCLRNKSAKEIHQAYVTLAIETQKTPEVHIFIGFAPVVDKKFLIDTPINLLKKTGVESNFFTSLDTIIGNSESEGSLLISALKRRKYNVSKGIPSKYLCEHIIPTLSTDYFQNNTRIVSPICTKYSSNKSIEVQSMKAVDFYGDVFMYSPSVQSLNIHAMNSNQSTYQYLLRRLSVWSVAKSSVPWFKGASHASEIPFLFPFTPLSNATKDDRSYSLTLMKYWTNFAKTGNVNGDGLQTWPQYDNRNKQYALLDTNVTILQNLYKDRVDFWLTTIPDILKLNTSTTTTTTDVPLSTEQKNVGTSATMKSTTYNSTGNGGIPVRLCSWCMTIVMIVCILGICCI